MSDVFVTAAVSNLKLKPLPRWRGRAIARPGSGVPQPHGRSLPGCLPQRTCQQKAGRDLLYAGTPYLARKIGRTAQNAKLPEGTATSSEFLMVNWWRSCSKEPSRSAQKKAGASTLNVKTPWADQAAKCCRTAANEHSRAEQTWHMSARLLKAFSTSSQSRLLSERVPTRET